MEATIARKKYRRRKRGSGNSHLRGAAAAPPWKLNTKSAVVTYLIALRQEKFFRYGVTSFPSREYYDLAQYCKLNKLYKRAYGV